MTPPALSVVLLTPDSYDTIRETIEWLGRQTARDRIELVLVAPSKQGLHVDGDELRTFHGVRTVAVGELTSTAKARAAGVREARAPVVVFAEDHSYPEPGWAEALIAAHRNGWSAVGPDVLNADPASMIGWADVFLGGRKVDPTHGQLVDDLPGRNSSYKRHVLLEYGTELEEWLEMETLLHWDLRARGHQLYLETAARTMHANYATLRGFLREQFYVGWVFAASRSRHWSVARRLTWAAASPLVPAVRLQRLSRAIARAARTRNLIPGVVPPLLLGLAANALGELSGYLLGLRSAPRHIVDVEFHRA